MRDVKPSVAAVVRVLGLVGVLVILAPGCDLLTGLFGAEPQHAAPPTILYVDPDNGDDANDGATPQTPLADPVIALEQIAEGTVDEVFFGGGTITLAETLEISSSVTITGGFDFETGEPDPVAIQTLFTGVPMLFHVRSGEVTLSGLTLRPAIGSAEDDTISSAVVSSASELRLEDVTVSFETEPYPALEAVSVVGGSTHLHNTTISDGASATGRAVGIGVHGSAGVTVTDCTVYAPESANDSSIAVAAGEFATLTVGRSILRGGAAARESHGVQLGQNTRAQVAESTIVGGASSADAEAYPQATGVTVVDNAGLTLDANVRIEGGEGTLAGAVGVFISTTAPVTVRETSLIQGGSGDLSYAVMVLDSGPVIIEGNFVQGADGGPGSALGIFGPVGTTGPVEVISNGIAGGGVDDAESGTICIVSGDADVLFFRNEISGSYPVDTVPSGVSAIAVVEALGVVEIDANRIHLIADWFPAAVGIYAQQTADLRVTNNIISTYATDVSTGLRAEPFSYVAIAHNTIIADVGPAGTNELAIDLAADVDGIVTGNLAYAPQDLGGDVLMVALMPGVIDFMEQREVRASSVNLQDPANMFVAPDTSLADGDDGDWRLRSFAFAPMDAAVDQGLQMTNVLPQIARAYLHDFTGQSRLPDGGSAIDIGALEYRP